MGIQFTEEELSKENIKNICSKIKLPEFVPVKINLEIDGNLEENDIYDLNENEGDIATLNNIEINNEKEIINKNKIKNILEEL